MAKSKDKINVIMRSTAEGSRYFYTTSRNKRAEKLLMTSYDPTVQKHVEFKEEKMR